MVSTAAALGSRSKLEQSPFFIFFIFLLLSALIKIQSLTGVTDEAEM
jgi:hypothetical protein